LHLTSVAVKVISIFLYR